MMTPIKIKTRSGAMIDVRVGDVVTMDEYDIQTTITEDDLAFDNELCRCGEYSAFNALWKDCTLHSRPTFEVGDEVNWCPIEDDFDDKVFKHSEPLTAGWKIRHASPDLREPE